MAQLNVNTHTTPLELAEFFKKLRADDTVSGKPGVDGELILYVNPHKKTHGMPSSEQEWIITRVAVDVVLQPLCGIAGGELAWRHVQSVIESDGPVKVRDLSGPTGVLARLWKDGQTAGGQQVHFVRSHAVPGADGAAQMPLEEALTEEQRKMVEALIDKLRSLSIPPHTP
jgi:hypothetical protein